MTAGAFCCSTAVRTGLHNASVRGLSEEFPASAIDGNTIGKISPHPPSLVQLSEAGVLSVFLKMDEIEHRAVIKFFVKKV
jgi:hypothetical protein